MKYRISFLFCLLFSAVICSADDIDSQWSEMMPLASKSLLLDIQEIAPKVLITVGERGHILKSKDGGQSWKQVRVPTRSTLTGLDFIDDKRGWVVGHDSTVLYTDDGGEHWTLQYRDADAEQPLFDVKMQSPNEGFAVGAYGLMLHTTNSGQRWNIIEPSRLEDPAFGYPHFYKIAPLADGLVMVGEAGMIAKLPGDDPAGWSRSPIDYNGSFFSIAELADGVLLVVGLRGHIYRSVDSGTTWQHIKTETVDNFYDVAYEPNTRRVAVVGADGSVLLSFDNGMHFRHYRLTERETLNAVLWTSEGKLIGVGFGGVKDLNQFVTQALNNQ
ncbi:MAG: hypothetical protein D6694_14145 [Gammaproteobacteria bacterium]|nr:MAG: hypothetical protein D6694_14145 [Gammaproteobacteria bacterium]